MVAAEPRLSGWFISVFFFFFESSQRAQLMENVRKTKRFPLQETAIITDTCAESADKD